MKHWRIMGNKVKHPLDGTKLMTGRQFKAMQLTIIPIPYSPIMSKLDTSHLDKWTKANTKRIENVN